MKLPFEAIHSLNCLYDIIKTQEQKERSETEQSEALNIYAYVKPCLI